MPSIDKYSYTAGEIQIAMYTECWKAIQLYVSIALIVWENHAVQTSFKKKTR